MVNRKNIEYDLKPLERILETIKKIISESGAYDRKGHLINRSQNLKERAKNIENAQELLPEAFALVYEAVECALNLTPHNVQLLAAIAMAGEKIIELPTGEGKTLAAVFTAYWASLSGRGVHVLTVNDYLAQRDALWMKPVYDLLDVSVDYINETSDRAARKKAYGADITYVTAKEAGFDYLRSFIAYDAEALVQRPFHFTVIDEVDSILIDEARIPLVISGDTAVPYGIEIRIREAVLKMEKGAHFNVDEYESTLYLDEAGIGLLEQSLQISNILDDNYISILEKAQAILQAEFILKRDVDYIVQNGKVRIVDKFTGRIAQNRQWTDELQTAVEQKEGLAQEVKGEVLNSITLQSFLGLYPAFCGMTGTACSAAIEFSRFYNTSVTVIPPNKPCIRTDHPDRIFASKRAKYKALAEEIKKVHSTGRPVLIGTCSVEESERLTDMLQDEIEGLNVLNAKNDAEEAKIIANAGMLGAVTISTNMAGRGVDIRLGGTNAENYDRICDLGGLYVIGTSRHESIRIDHQLRGRAGRQGDPGMSRFFISLEDDLIVKYGLYERIPEQYKNADRDEPLQNAELTKAVQRTQKIVEVQTFDAKSTLTKYSRVVEDQRKLVHQKRERILLGETSLSTLAKERPEKYQEILAQVPERAFLRAQRQIELFAINKCWSDHLLFVDSVMDEIRVISEVRGDPLVYYNQKLISGFEELEEHIYEVVMNAFESVVIKDGRIDLDAMDIKGPTSTKTYLVHDGTELQSLFGGASAIGAAAFAAPMFFFYLLFEKHKSTKRELK